MPTVKPYYEEYKRILNSKLNDVQQLVQPEQTEALFESPTPEIAFIRSLEDGITKFPFRYYQKEAIYTLHHIYKQAVDICRSNEEFLNERLKQPSNSHIKPLLEVVDKEAGRKAPFLGFEMATGSGKTMLMGGSIYYLHKMYGIKNFLIITPSSTEIYKKTIRNFRIGTKETVWNDEVPFKPNIVNGDNFKDTKDLFHTDTDANIFIFNIDKFGTNATQTKKNWEGSVWQDNEGNSISLLDFLADNDLIIITDEAHHAQSRKAKAVINAFKPIAVLEYTATAVEKHRSDKKKNQTIVYKYDIKRFLEDKYGKLVRLLALPGETSGRRGRQSELSNTEKYKLQTFFLVHLLKKKALSNDPNCRDLKAIGFVKVKNEIIFAEKVEKYIREELSTDSESLEIILEKAKSEDTETTNLILEMIEDDYGSDITLLQKEIGKVVFKSILLHSKSDKIIKRQFDDIQKNDVEIVIFIDMLNEGIDMPNIYSMVVINDTPSEFKTSVKQIVGRGVRLNKEKREYDDLAENDLMTHTEKLHIICDKGASFEEVVMEIQKEFGLNDKTFALERGEELLVTNPVKYKKIEGVRIPKIKIDFKRKKEASIKNVIENYSKIIDDYISTNCFNRTIDKTLTQFIKYSPDSFFTEIDLFADSTIFHKMGEDQNWNYEQLILSEIDIKEIYGRVLAKLKPIPDIPKTYQVFKDYGELLNNETIYFYSLDEVDQKLALNALKDSFVYFYIHYVENEYFELDMSTLDSESETWLLTNEFKSSNIKVRKKDLNNDSRLIDDEKDIVELIRNGYYFYGYKESIFDYDKFDSLPEKQLADYFDHIVLKSENNENYWARNDRNIYFEYGTHKYYPDFILFLKKILFVVEMKGEKFSNIKKNRLLLELNNLDGIGEIEKYRGVVVFQYQMRNLKEFKKEFEDFIREADEYYDQFQTKSIVIPDGEVPVELKYIEYIPAYEARQAYNNYILNKKPKIQKWLKVENDEYPTSLFATLVKNGDIGLEYKNKWVIMDSDIPNASEIEQNIIMLCHHPDIESNSYKKNLIIRHFLLTKTEEEYGFLKDIVRIIHLTSFDNDVKEIKDIRKFTPIGLKWDKK